MEPSATEHNQGTEPAGPVAERRRILAIVNPVAGAGVQKTGDLVERARKLGIALEVVETRPDWNGEEAALSRAEEFDCYLVVGGDGTVMEVASAAMVRGVPLAILPRGTANVVAWHFGIPFDVPRALKVAMEGRAIRVDVGRARQQDFLLTSGLGYDAHIIRDATRELKRRFGFLAYLYASLRNIGRKPYSFRVTLDDQKPIHLMGVSAVITNIATLAGNIRAVRSVSAQDGVLDLLVFSSASIGVFLRVVVLGLFGRVEQDPRVHLFRASRIRVESTPQAPIEIDGEILKGRHAVLEAEVLPGALTLLVPPDGMLRLPWVPDLKGLSPPWVSGTEDAGEAK